VDLAITKWVPGTSALGSIVVKDVTVDLTEKALISTLIKSGALPETERSLVDASVKSLRDANALIPLGNQAIMPLSNQGTELVALNGLGQIMGVWAAIVEAASKSAGDTSGSMMNALAMNVTGKAEIIAKNGGQSAENLLLPALQQANPGASNQAVLNWLSASVPWTVDKFRKYGKYLGAAGLGGAVVYAVDAVSSDSQKGSTNMPNGETGALGLVAQVNAVTTVINALSLSPDQFVALVRVLKMDESALLETLWAIAALQVR